MNANKRHDFLYLQACGKFLWLPLKTWEAEPVPWPMAVITRRTRPPFRKSLPKTFWSTTQNPRRLSHCSFIPPGSSTGNTGKTGSSNLSTPSWPCQMCTLSLVKNWSIGCVTQCHWSLSMTQESWVATSQIGRLDAQVAENTNVSSSTKAMSASGLLANEFARIGILGSITSMEINSIPIREWMSLLLFTNHKSNSETINKIHQRPKQFLAPFLTAKTKWRLVPFFFSRAIIWWRTSPYFCKSDPNFSVFVVTFVTANKTSPFFVLSPLFFVFVFLLSKSWDCYIEFIQWSRWFCFSVNFTFRINEKCYDYKRKCTFIC